jgi:hypothetical protein
MKGNVVKGAIFLVALAAFILVAWRMLGLISGHTFKIVYDTAGQALGRTFG